MRLLSSINLMSIFAVLLALALTLPLFGKGLIAVMMAIGLLLSLPVLWRNYRTVFLSIPAARIDLGLLAIVALCWFIAGATGLNPDAALSHALRFGSILLGGVILYTALTQAGLDMSRLYQTVTLCAGTAAGLIILNALYPIFPSDMVRTSYGSVMALLFPLVLREWMNKKSFTSAISLSLLIMAIFTLGGRTGWVTLGVVIILCGCLLPWRATHIRIVTFAKLLCGVVTAGALGVVLYVRLVGMDIFRARVTDVDMNRPASGRLEIWREASTFISDNPWFGVGIKGVRELNMTGHPLHVHNVILELLVDTGWCGLIAVTFVFAWLFAGFIRAYRNCHNTATRLDAMPLLIAFMAYGVASLALTSFFHAWWFLYGVVLCILLRYMSHIMQSQQNTKA